MTHELKTLPLYFDQVECGNKTFEIRKDDRGFQPQDTLLLREWTGTDYTGRSIRVAVTYITDYEQRPGYVVMGIKPGQPKVWRPIESAPKDGTLIDCSNGVSRFTNCIWVESRGIFAFHAMGHYFDTNATHWMPIAQPPKERSEE